jgi:hypothetical protein
MVDENTGERAVGGGAAGFGAVKQFVLSCRKL